MSDINIVDCKYTLLLRNGGTYFADSLFGLFTEIMKHRFEHWKRGDGWRD